ncbi:MAG: hypothetical protein UY76_C0062G0005 [Candidatus Uhrbacteria bacterium GW2011_GWA2_52_8d]|uniref:Glycerophosphoryl diester phosphodiesterase membrane domain-containing protein n=1 Tax=Candidatus Uhrbacteria bacterium GW2011_GWA2_52_8d TaxID=1618979 RepID=A0A0G2AFI4_9BACT|nr:MAG: hypothetical protein UY76_C0062G0005 [Candidatus Uhrbacteria bacterium GW2011_GWA2_52_8d]
MPKPLLSVGELIDQSWDLFRARMTELLSISGWLLITAILFAFALAFYPSASKLQLDSDLTALETMGVMLFSLTSLVIVPLVSFWIYIALTKALGAHFARRTVNAKTAIREAKSAFFPTLLTSVMVMLTMLLAIVIGFVLAAILATLGFLTSVSSIIFLANLILLIGIFVSLFLTIKWVMYYFMAPYLTMLDGTPAKLALATSRQLIEGRFWSVLLRMFVPKLVFIMFGVFAMSIVAFLVGILIDASAGLNLDFQLRITTMTQTIVPILIAVLINPLIIISDVLLLRSLRS